MKGFAWPSHCRASPLAPGRFRVRGTSRTSPSGVERKLYPPLPAPRIGPGQRRLPPGRAKMFAQVLVILLASVLVGSVEDSVLYRTWHRGRKCSSAVTVYETEPRYLLDVCLALETDLGRLDTHVQFSCITGSNKFTLLQKNYDLLDSSCSDGALSSTVVEHDYACRHDAASGFWIKSQCGPLPSSLSTPAQLEVLPYTDGSCTLTTEALVGPASTRRLLLGTCQPVYNTAGFARAGRKRQQGTSDVLYSRKVHYLSGPVGATGAWDAGVKVTANGGRRLSALENAPRAMSDTGKVNDTAAGWSSHRRALLAAAPVDPIVLLVERYNFEDKTCEGPVKFSWTVQYTVQTTTEKDNQCVPDPLFAGFYYHVATAAVPTRFPTASPTNPTATPSSRPTRLPTANPSAIQTVEPTVRPTAVPTQPSPLPTTLPTAAPTDAGPPSPLPTTANPTCVPSALPTTPSASPTTAIPTAMPTFAPSAASLSNGLYRQGLAYYWAGSGASLDATTMSQGTAGSFEGVFGIAVASNGAFLYGTSWWRNVIYKIDMVTITPVVFAGTDSSYGAHNSVDDVGTNAKFDNPTGIVVTSDSSTLYVSDYSYNSNNCKIRKIVVATATVSTLAGKSCGAIIDGTGTNAKFNSPHGLALDEANGYLYVSDSSAGSIRRILISTAAVETVIVRSTAGEPGGLALAPTLDWLYVADSSHNVIYRVNVGSFTGTQLATSTIVYIGPKNAGTAASTSGYAEATGATTYSKWDNPRNLQFSGDGNTIYITETDNSACIFGCGATGNRVRAIDLTSSYFASYIVAGSTAGTLAAVGGDGDRTYGTSARFSQSAGVAIYGNNLYVAEPQGSCIRRVNLQPVEGASYLVGDGTMSSSDTTVPSSTAATLSSGTSCNIPQPAGIVASSDGTTLYTVSYTRQVLVRITGVGPNNAKASCQTVAGTNTPWSTAASIDGIGTSATFSAPLGLAIAPDNSYLYVSDNSWIASSCKIRKVSLSTLAVSTLAGGGSCSSDVTGTGTVATFMNPGNMVINAAGTFLYVTTEKGCLVRKVDTATGAVTAVFGTTGTCSDSATTLNSPRGIALSSDELSLYISTGSNRILKLIISSNTLSIIAGSGSITTSATAAYQEATNIGTSYVSKLDSPYGLYRYSNYLYFTESSISSLTSTTGVSSMSATTNCNGNRIRRIDLGSTTYYRTELVAGVNAVSSCPNNAKIENWFSASGQTQLGGVIKFSYPANLVLIGSSLYVTEIGANDIRKVQLTYDAALV